MTVIINAAEQNKSAAQLLDILKGITSEAIDEYQAAARRLNTIALEESIPTQNYLTTYTDALARAEAAMNIDRIVARTGTLKEKEDGTYDLDRLLYSLNREAYSAARRKGTPRKYIVFVMTVADRVLFYLTEETNI